MNPDLFHILRRCRHGGGATMLDRHKSEDRNLPRFVNDLDEERRLRPDLVFEAAIKKKRLCEQAEEPKRKWRICDLESMRDQPNQISKAYEIYPAKRSC
jgi:hypothetical protein